jgi:hypothetical protein
MSGWVVILVVAATLLALLAVDSWLAVRTALSGSARQLKGDNHDLDYAVVRQQTNAFHFGG